MIFSKKISLKINKKRHPRESGDPKRPIRYWIPACAGMTVMLFLFLSGCGTLYGPPPPGTHYLTKQKRRQQLMAINSWNMYAALGVRFANKNTMAHFYWWQTGNDFTINIFTPLNIGGVKITGNKKQVILWRSTTDKITAKTPEQLMYQELGWSLPLFNMKYWVLGLAALHIPYHAKYDSYNHLNYLQQQGWEIEYADFRSINGIDLPRKIWLKNPRLQVKLVVEKWRI